MVFQLVQSAYVGAALTTATSVTFTNPVGPGNLVVGAVGYFAGNGITLPAGGITDNKGNVYSQQASCIFNSTPTNWAYNMFFLPSVNSKPVTLTFALSGGNAGGIYVAEFTPGGYFDQYKGLNGNVNMLPVTGILTTSPSAPPQAQTLVVALESAQASAVDHTVNPQSGGNWITLVRDVTSDPNAPVNPGIGPVVIFQYQVVSTPSGLQGISTGFNNTQPSFTAAMIADFCPSPVVSIFGQTCVG